MTISMVEVKDADSPPAMFSREVFEKILADAERETGILLAPAVGMEVLNGREIVRWDGTKWVAVDRITPKP